MHDALPDDRPDESAVPRGALDLPDRGRVRRLARPAPLQGRPYVDPDPFAQRVLGPGELRRHRRSDRAGSGRAQFVEALVVDEFAVSLEQRPSAPQVVARGGCGRAGETLPQQVALAWQDELVPWPSRTTWSNTSGARSMVLVRRGRFGDGTDHRPAGAILGQRCGRGLQGALWQVVPPRAVAETVPDVWPCRVGAIA